MINKRLDRRLGITARQFNAKITRLSKLNATLPKDQKFKLPSRMNLKTIRKEMTANQVRREIRRANIFLRKGAENIITTRGGVRVPRYEYFGMKQEIKYNIKYHQARYNELSNITMTRGGKKVFGNIRNPERFTAQRYLSESSEDLYNIGDYNVKQWNRIKKIYSGRIDELERKAAEFSSVFVNKILDSYSDIVYGTDDASGTGGYKGKIDYIKQQLQKLTLSEIENLMDTEEYVHDLAYQYHYYLYDMSTEKAQGKVNNLIDGLKSNIDRIVKNYIDNR